MGTRGRNVVIAETRYLFEDRLFVSYERVILNENLWIGAYLLLSLSLACYRDIETALYF